MLRFRRKIAKKWFVYGVDEPTKRFIEQEVLGVAALRKGIVCKDWHSRDLYSCDLDEIFYLHMLEWDNGLCFDIFVSENGGPPQEWFYEGQSVA